MRTVNADSKSRNRTLLLWPVTGLVIGMVAAMNPFGAPHITLRDGIAAWCADMILVLVLCGHPIGARFGALLAGVFMAVPCFVWTAPLLRGLLMCFTALPFAAASALVFAPSIAGFRGRLAYLCDWCGKRPVKRRFRSFDREALRRFIIAAVILTISIAVVKAASASGHWLAVRWFAGGVMLFAIAELATACHNFLTAMLGITVAPFFNSPYRSTSVGEFWTRRWNLPTSEIFRTFCFVPLARRSIGLGVFVSFLVSAIAHWGLFYMMLGKWKISLICGAFFLVQPLFIAAERRLNVRRWRPAAGRAWTLVVLAITSPLIVEPALQIFEPSWGAPDQILLPTVCMLGFVIVFSGALALASLASLPAKAKEQTA